MRAPHRGRGAAAWLAGVFALTLALPAIGSDPIDTIARVKPSVVAVGTFEAERSPSFEFRGTGFAVGSGQTIVTNAHVLPRALDSARKEAIAILLPGPHPESARVFAVRRIADDAAADLALLRLEGETLPPLALGDSDSVREGQSVLITGFPIGAVLGAYPLTHRGMVSAVTPIAIPQRNARDLKPALVHRLSAGSFPVFQLDATAYPGSSGSPIYDPANGNVLGIVNMVFVKSTKESVLASPSGITYAIPAIHLRRLMERAAK